MHEPPKFNEVTDYAGFTGTPAGRSILGFVTAAAEELARPPPAEPLGNEMQRPFRALEGMFYHIESLIDAHPPTSSGPSRGRFGDPAFSDFCHQGLKSTPRLVNALLCETPHHIDFAPVATELDAAAIEGGAVHDFARYRRLIVGELVHYLTCSFGSPQRLDYGTGHELHFLCFVLCLWKVNFFGTDDCDRPKEGALEESEESVSTHDTAAPSSRSCTRQVLRSIPTIIFPEYLRVVRKLQNVYRLEPAGSRGVWGLDDFQFLPFLWGAFDMVPSGSIPEQILTEGFLQTHKNNLYADAIRHVMKVKSGAPFAETSPLLHDVSGLPSWARVAAGLLKMYKGEVLASPPLLQHFRFGPILPA